jgi:hypothetical protein
MPHVPIGYVGTIGLTWAAFAPRTFVLVFLLNCRFVVHARSPAEAARACGQSLPGEDSSRYSDEGAA